LTQHELKCSVIERADNTNLTVYIALNLSDLLGAKIQHQKPKGNKIKVPEN